MDDEQVGRLPEVTVVMPAHNAARYIAASVDSVLAQTFSNWELLVVDDASTDDTAALLVRQYGMDQRIVIIRLATNSGAAVARNIAIERARGRFIAFLDSDDLWLPEKLAVQVEFMKTQAVPFTFTAYERVTPEGTVVGTVGVPATTSYSEMLKTSVIGCSTAVYDTEYFGRVFMPIIRMRQDFGLWLALLKRAERAIGIQQVLVRYQVRPGSISSNKKNAALYTWKIYRQVERLPLGRAVWLFVNYAGRGYLRHHFPSLARKLGVLI